MCCNRARPRWAGPLPLIRGIRGQASGGNQLNEATDDNHHVALPQRHARRHSTGPAGMLMQPWNPGPIKTGAPYMSTRTSVSLIEDCARTDHLFPKGPHSGRRRSTPTRRLRRHHGGAWRLRTIAQIVLLAPICMSENYRWARVAEPVHSLGSSEHGLHVGIKFVEDFCDDVCDPFFTVTPLVLTLLV